jgi:hypothetical protein
MSNSNRPSSHRTPYIPVTPIEGFRTQYIAYLLKGENRANLLKKIYKSFVRTNPRERDAKKYRWLRTLVNDLRGSVPFELVSSRLGLYQLFDKVVATPEQWSWLREIDWYRPPTAEEIRREKAKYEEYARIGELRSKVPSGSSKMIVEAEAISEICQSPPIVTGSLRIVDPEILPASSSAARDMIRSEFIPVKDIGIQFPGIDSPVEFVPRVITAPIDPIVVTIDIEGAAPEYLEIAAIANFNDQQLGARLWYLSGRDDEKIRREARYCHGINPVELRKLAVSDIDVIKMNLKRWLLQLGPNVLIVSADEVYNSDVYRFVQDLQVFYVNIPLPRWRFRLDTWAHKETQVAKRELRKIGGVTCDYKRLHSIPLVKRDEPRYRSGAHCGYFDALELAYHIQFNQLWSLLRDNFMNQKNGSDSG